MKSSKITLTLLVIVFSSCAKVGIYHVAEKPLPDGNGIYLIKPSGFDDFNYKMRDARFPDVNAGASCLVFIKSSSEEAGGQMTDQVYWSPLSFPNPANTWSVKLTHSNTNKIHPIWGKLWYAYQQQTASGEKIVVSSHNNLTSFELSPIVRGGFDFFDEGSKIVFTANDGLYWINIDPNAVPVKISECQPSTTQCSFPVISHNGKLLAYRQSTRLMTGNIEIIKIIKAGTWDFVKILNFSSSIDLSGIHSFDFSPDDKKIYFTARAKNITDSESANKLEIYSIKISSGTIKRITNNHLPDYYPSTLALKKKFSTCEEFESHPAREKTYVGNILTLNAVIILVEKYQLPGGTWTAEGFAQVEDRNYANGSNLCLRSNNANFNFQHHFPVKQIKLKFAELGGNNNISVNGVFRNIRDLTELNGITIGGVAITVNASLSGANWIGELKLNGNVKSFSIGGQELWIDDYCFIPN